MKNYKIGLQLFGVRDKMEQDMEATLKAVKEMGYDYVEFAGYFGKTAGEVKALLDKYGLTAVSVHQGPSLFDEEGQSAFDYLKDIGVTYCAIPWYEADHFVNNWQGTMDYFTELGKKMNENGIKLMYHNHDFEFYNKIGGVSVLDKMYEAIPADLMLPELDLCWVHYAGNNPVDYLKKYAARIEVVHFKDFVCEKLGGGPVYDLIDNSGEAQKPNNREESGFKFTPVGYGIQDWKAILSACDETNIEYIIVEQDNTYDTDSLTAAKMSRDYLKDTFNI